MRALYKRHKRTLYIVMLCVLILFLLYSCAQVRKVTYPPGYVYIEKHQLESAMFRLGDNLSRIDDIMWHKQSLSDEDRRRVLFLLRSSESIADTLGTGKAQTNHLLLDQHINDFKDDLKTARESLEASPPNYYPAGLLQGSCTACHRYRRE